MLFKSKVPHFRTASMRAQNSESGAHVYDPQAMVELQRSFLLNKESVAAMLSDSTISEASIRRADFIQASICSLDEHDYFS